MYQKTEYIIETHNLTKRYGNVLAVHDLSLKIKRSSCFALLGPNGAGKTTTILMLLGLIKPSKGEISILGKNNQKNSCIPSFNVGYLPENVGFYPDLTGRKHLELIIRLKMKKSNVKKEVESLLKWSNLNEKYWNKKTKTYSRGMLQRLGIAQAFAGNPQIVILDEPLASIDPLGREDFIDKFRIKNAQGITIIIASHIIPDVEELSDSLAILDNGNLKIFGEILSMAKSYGFDEYEIIQIKNNSSMRINELNDALDSIKDILKEPPNLLSDRIIVKSENPEEIKKFLGNFKNFKLRPIYGTLKKIYRKIILGE